MFSNLHFTLVILLFYFVLFFVLFFWSLTLSESSRVKFTQVVADILDSAHSQSHSALSKMTRRKNSLQLKESETLLSATELQNLDFNMMSEIQFRSTIIKLLVALEKSIKHSRDFVTAELRSNQAKIKNRFNEMQSKLDVLTAKVNEV